ncbi:unnamed protein product [Caenorhabditis angaria]|uniref:Uncharacterized protein n=1 Tax=Caenorhabditis angaria TaxID=860376 RepID=A0A9P1INY9_9PELO|nr:unnamed protein product [Caenorhabditis angaria]
MRIILLLLLSTVLTSSWVIYRKSHKKKLVCREETEWDSNNTLSTATSSPSDITSHADSDSDSSSEESAENRRGRSKRDIDVDPILKQPIIYLGAQSNSTVFIDDGDFDIVSDSLSREEIEAVKQQIMNTCNALNSN